MKSSDNCGFCEKNVETIVHIFTSYDETYTLWSELNLHFHRKTAESFEYNLYYIW